MTPPKATTHDDLTSAQKKALAKAVTANKRLSDHQAKAEDLVAVRDAAIKDALELDVTQTLIATTLDLSQGMVWKIKEGVRTAQLEARQRKGKSKTSPSWIEGAKATKDMPDRRRRTP